MISLCSLFYHKIEDSLTHLRINLWYFKLVQGTKYRGSMSQERMTTLVDTVRKYLGQRIWVDPK